MGSPRFAALETASLQMTRAWFSPDDVLSAHTHSTATFAVILRGSFDLGFPNAAIRHREFDCSAGTIFTEPAGEIHLNRIGSAGAEVLIIQLDPSSDDDCIQPFRHFLTDHINHFRHPAIDLNARRLAREVSHPDALSELSAEALALDMLVTAARLRRPRSSGAPPWLRRAEEYIRAHFRERLTIADVANAVGVHPAHLATVFREHCHAPVGQFIRSLRLEWVADRLEHSGDSISSIAYAAGFADQSHLTRAFKGYIGQTPGAFRRGLG